MSSDSLSPDIIAGIQRALVEDIGPGDATIAQGSGLVLAHECATARVAPTSQPDWVTPD